MAISQREQVLTHLKKGLPITSWEAIHEFRATRLSAIIFDLRQEGYNIITENITNPETGKKFGRYTLVKETN